jgi:hypothetical protein
MYTLFFAYDCPCLKPSRPERNLDIIHYFELYLQEFLEYCMANKLGIFSAITVRSRDGPPFKSMGCSLDCSPFFICVGTRDQTSGGKIGE